MTDVHWTSTYAKSLGVFLSGQHLGAQTDRGEEIIDDSFYIMFNSHFQPVIFAIPEKKWGDSWMKVIDTHDGSFEPEESLEINASENIEVKERSIILLKHISGKNA
jgi:glycogen operon protein